MLLLLLLFFLMLLAQSMFVENSKPPSLVSFDQSICTELPMLMLLFLS